MGMASEILRFDDDRPLVGDVEQLGDPRPGRERDESIIRTLRESLRERGSSNTEATPPQRRRSTDRPGEDKYEPQRLGRKICWQYDSSAHKVPLLRRHYI